MRYLRRLFEHFKTYHAYGPPRLKYMGIVGGLSYGLFYFLRFTKAAPQPLDDLVVRITAILLLSALALKEYWPEKLKPYFIAYAYIAMLFSLPFFAVFTALERGGGMPAISNTFIMLCFLVLLTDWRNTLAMLTVGAGAACLTYMALNSQPKIPMDMVAQLPAFALIVLSGNLFKFSTEQIDAERKLRATQALAGSIAHEMRNPLSQLKHSLENMRQALPAPTLSAQPQTLEAQAVDELYRQLAQSGLAVKRGLQIISMTLDEVSAKPLDTNGFAYLSAADICNKAVQEYGYQTSEERDRVGLVVQEDFSFRGDETAFLFVLFNLIKNALYYLASCPDMRIVITVERTEVRVRDNGPGIAPEFLPHLFEPFRSVGKSGGTGLGLAYCQRVMKAFGGSISCNCAAGRYTEFVMRFPVIGLQESEAHRQSVLESARSIFAGKRILVVDDDASLRLTTRHKLLPLDAIVDEAPDGQRALDMLAKQHYDLMVLDLNMPVMDGYALVERVRHSRVTPNRDLRIVAYTSEPAHLASVKTQKAGMDGFVSKPCAQVPLVQALRAALEQPRTPLLPSGRQLAGMRVVLADDSPPNRKAVAAYLRHAGATVVEAGSGQVVMELLHAQGGCDAILMDINMPGVDGLEAARAIRASVAPWRNVRIIALTAHSDQIAIEQAQSAGMDDFLVKPVDADVLYAKLLSLDLPRSLASSVALLESDDTGLINLERLESYRRLGMLDELLNDYIPEIARLVDKLTLGVSHRDFDESLAALHSLVGMSGEAGALALYHLVRRVYVPMVEDRQWPTQVDWVDQITDLANQTERALRSYGVEHAMDRAT